MKCQAARGYRVCYSGNPTVKPGLTSALLNSRRHVKTAPSPLLILILDRIIKFAGTFPT